VTQKTAKYRAADGTDAEKSLLGLGFSGSPAAFELTLGASFFSFPFIVPSMQSGIARM
jgi:hypothetical protein